ncbi:MAG: hypothetical protein M1829_005294 [Trizodia sp. TS-e1964]|nr:MAG: hypothetical protein M1829_005294 [Trizodia sp. TS-e1964]
MASPSLVSWALPRLSRILPLPDTELAPVLDYTLTLSKQEAGEYLKNFLGDSPQALEFISSFNSRRGCEGNGKGGGQRGNNRGRKGEAKQSPNPVHHGPNSSSQKQASNSTKMYGDEHDDGYSCLPGGQISGAASTSLSAGPANVPKQPPPKHKNPPSASGALISDSRRAPPKKLSQAPQAKISLTGGTSMQGQASVIADLDSAIRSLEIQTNPSLQDDRKRKCNCIATRHPLLDAAPNCLECGKVICVKEGLGPCTFCQAPLFSPSEIQTMVRTLREERGRERMEANNLSQKRAEVSKKASPYTAPSVDFSYPKPGAKPLESDNEKLNAAKLHRDRLLEFQATSARRTRIIDEAADFETPISGQSIWATPQERALQLKRQQKVLREQRWNARPEYEKRRIVASIDLKGKKVIRKMATIERPESGNEEESIGTDGAPADPESKISLSHNPLLGGMIRPTYKASADNDESSGKKREPQESRKGWRKVQDDYEDNEEILLNGGIYGGRKDGVAFV